MFPISEKTKVNTHVFDIFFPPDAKYSPRAQRRRSCRWDLQQIQYSQGKKLVKIKFSETIVFQSLEW